MYGSSEEAPLFTRYFTDRQNGFFRAYYGSTSNDVSYLGTSPYDNDFLDTYAGAALGYSFSNNQWNVSADVALQWEKNEINDQAVSEVYPLANVSAGFSPSQKHSFRAYFHFGANYPRCKREKRRIYCNRTN